MHVKNAIGTEQNVTL